MYKSIFIWVYSGATPTIFGRAINTEPDIATGGCGVGAHFILCSSEPRTAKLAMAT